MLAAFLAFCLAACGGEDDSDGKRNKTNDGKPTESVTPTGEAGTKEDEENLAKDRETIANCFTAAGKLANDPEYSVEEGAQFMCGMTDGELWLRVRTNGNSEEIEKMWLKLVSADGKAPKLLCNEFSKIDGFFLGTVCVDYSLVWKACSIDAESDAKLFPSGAVRHDDKYVTVWTTVENNDARRMGFDQAISDFMANHPGVEVIHRSMPYTNMLVQLRQGYYDAALPDIFEVMPDTPYHNFVKDGYMVDLTASANGLSGLSGEMLEKFQTGGKVYAIPYCGAFSVMYVNMDVLGDAGFETVPQSLGELYNCCEKLKAIGYYPFGLAYSRDDSYCYTGFVETLLQKSSGSRTIENIYSYIETWNQENVQKTFLLLRELMDKGYFDPAGKDEGNMAVMQNFIDGKSAFFVGGTWYTTDLQKYDNIDVVPFPVLNPAQADRNEFAGLSVYGLAVSVGCENPENVSKYVCELSKTLSGRIYRYASHMPAWNVDDEFTSAGQLYKKAAKYGLEADELILDGSIMMMMEELDGGIIMMMEDYSQYCDMLFQYFDGLLSAEEFVNQMTTLMQ